MRPSVGDYVATRYGLGFVLSINSLQTVAYWQVYIEQEHIKRWLPAGAILGVVPAPPTPRKDATS